MRYTIEPMQDLNGYWQIFADGVKADSGAYYASRDAADLVVARKEQYDAMNAAVETEIGQERHYGVQVWSEPGRGATPSWYRTDPFSGQVVFAFAWYTDEPPPVAEYTRDQYERACQAAGVEAASDSDLGNYADKFGEFWPTTHDAHVVITADLRRRRMAGLKREQPPAAPVATFEVEVDGRRCDECGKDIVAGQAMTASLGVACGPDCYDAMADRPGRYSTQQGARP